MVDALTIGKGDLDSAPPLDRIMHISDIRSLTYLRVHARIALHEISVVESIIDDRRAMLLVELATVRPGLDLAVKSVHHQLRARDDQQTGQIAIEQWVPSEDMWLVSGYFPHTTPTEEIVRQLKAGDPRHQSLADHVADVRATAEINAKAADERGTQKVLAAVDSLSSRALDDMIAVETALKTGEVIHFHGDDARFVDRAIDRTRTAAAQGDLESQAVLTHGVRDNALCANPQDNPLRR